MGAVGDFALDLLGFVIPVGKAVSQATKLTGKLGTKLFTGAKIIGAAAVGALNPADGLGALAEGLGQGTRQMLSTAARAFKLKHPPGLPGELAVVEKYTVSPSRLVGLSPDSQGVYHSLDGQSQYIRHVDKSGKASVYQVREASGGSPMSSVQVRVINPKTYRQTEFILNKTGADQWQRLGLPGGVEGMPYKSYEVPMDEVNRVLSDDGKTRLYANFCVLVEFDVANDVWRKLSDGKTLGAPFGEQAPTSGKVAAWTSSCGSRRHCPSQPPLKQFTQPLPPFPRPLRRSRRKSITYGLAP